MQVEKGAALGPYEILAHLGSGGMGEVWRARDARIGRDVAIKILGQTTEADEQALQRFEREARAAGSLNHPGLVTVFDVALNGSSPYIVMELLAGQSLREMLGGLEPVPLPLPRAIDYAIQIAKALGAAHDRGIIHRDLKPENVFIASDGRVKVLDFGLAKLAPDYIDVDGRRRTSKHLTAAGTIVGTPAYMSPEQVRADSVDHRTDIFSLGVLLYEMIAGRSPFRRETGFETMDAVLHADPPPIENPRLARELEVILRHCLEKNPRDRFQSAGDLAFDLESLPASARVPADAREDAKPVWRRAGAIAVMSLMGVVAAGFVLRRLGSDASPAAAPRRAYTQLTSGDGLEMQPALAPDGNVFAYVALHGGDLDVHVQRMDGRPAENVTADSSADDSEPAFSPDGSQIAFRSERDGGGIFLMAADGRWPRRLTDFGHNPAWSPDGTQLAVATEGVGLLPAAKLGGRASELWVVDVRSGARRPLVPSRNTGLNARDVQALQPSWSPDGKRIAFWGFSSRSEHTDIWTVDPNADDPARTLTRVTSDDALHWNPVWSPDGGYLYFGSDLDGALNLWRVPMDEERAVPAGAAESVGLPATAAGNFGFARSGEMVYVTAPRSHRVLAIALDVNAGTAGAPRQILAGSRELASFQPSPDGTMIAYASSDHLFVARTDGTHVRQLTRDAARDRSPDWSADGRALYFSSNREGDRWHIWNIQADGSRLTRITSDADLARIGVRSVHSPVAMPGGRTLLVQTDGSVSALVHLDRAPGQRLERLPAFLVQAEPSPDGQLIAARERTTTGVSSAITLFSVPRRAAVMFLPSGSAPHWTPDSRRVVYSDGRNLRVFDLENRTSRIVPLPTFEGVSTEDSHLSGDAMTLYLSQTIDQCDVWLVRFPDQ